MQDVLQLLYFFRVDILIMKMNYFVAKFLAKTNIHANILILSIVDTRKHQIFSRKHNK